MNTSLSMIVALAAFAGPAWGAPRTVTLSMPTMDFPMCTITVTKALTRVPGVAQADVNFDNRETTVTFDDVRTTPAALARGNKNAGCPFNLVGSIQ